MGIPSEAWNALQERNIIRRKKKFMQFPMQPHDYPAIHGENFIVQITL